MKTWLKRAFLIVLALGILGGATLAFLPQPVAVETARVGRGPLRVTIDGTGQTRVRDRYVVAAPVAGQLERITLRAGDEVGVGDEVAWIAPPVSPLLDPRTRAEIEARVAATEAAEAQARAAIDQAKLAQGQAWRERERAKAMVASQTLTQRELDAAEFELRARARAVEAAELAAETARREVAAARTALAGFEGATSSPETARVAVRSPARGLVLRLFVENAGPVAPGTPLLEIGDPAGLELVVDLLTADAVQVASGMRVELDQWGGARPLAGVVRRIEPSAFTKISALGITEQRVNVVVDPAGDAGSWSALRDGWRVEAHVIVWESGDARIVPSGALFRDGEGWASFAVEDDEARLHRVDVGHRGATHVEVLSGLDETALVVLHPSDKLADGTKVVLP
jgi:HlyD family secretion protein